MAGRVVVEQVISVLRLSAQIMPGHISREELGVELVVELEGNMDTPTVTWLNVRPEPTTSRAVMCSK